MSFPLMRTVSSRRTLRLISFAGSLLAVTLSLAGITSAQGNNGQAQSGLSNIQRFDIMRSKLEAMRRSAEQLAHQRNSRIDQLDADVAALKELEVQQSNQIQEAEAQLREFETECQRLSEEAAG